MCVCGSVRIFVKVRDGAPGYTWRAIVAWRCVKARSGCALNCSDERVGAERCEGVWRCE